jgi:hypothetical protein
MHGVSVDDATDQTQPDTASADGSDSQRRRKGYETGGRSTGRKLPPHRAKSLGNGSTAAATNDAMTTEESSTSCGEDSSDGNGGGGGFLPAYFDVIREESIVRRPKNVTARDVKTSSDSDGGIQSAVKVGGNTEASQCHQEVEQDPSVVISGGNLKTVYELM